MQQAQPQPNGTATPIYAGSLAEACAQLSTAALGNVILRALVEQVGRTEAVEALQELLRRVAYAGPVPPP